MPNLTEEEEMIIEKYVLMPLAKKALDYDRQVLEKSKLKFPQKYLKLNENTNISLQKEMSHVRKALLELKIRPIRKDSLHYEFVIRGHSHPVGFHPNIARDKINKWINEILYD